MKSRSQRPPKVLYVEDDRFWRKRALKYLPGNDLELTAVATAEEGFEIER